MNQEKQPGLSSEEIERVEVAAKYKVADPSKLSKKDGQWYFGEMTVEDWDKLFNRDDEEKYWQR